jgi:hypothetical protein
LDVVNGLPDAARGNKFAKLERFHEFRGEITSVELSIIH